MIHRTPLPFDPIDRASALVRRSQPSALAPSLSLIVPPDAVQYLAEARNTRAALYASMEDLTDRVRRCAEDADAAGVIVDVVDEEDARSLVHHIDAISDSLGDEFALISIPLAAGARR